jgi:hypothetical protein
MGPRISCPVTTYPRRVPRRSFELEPVNRAETCSIQLRITCEGRARPAYVNRYRITVFWPPQTLQTSFRRSYTFIWASLRVLWLAYCRMERFSLEAGQSLQMALAEKRRIWSATSPRTAMTSESAG